MQSYGAKEIAQVKMQFDRFYLEKRSDDAARHLEQITTQIIDYQIALERQIGIIKGTTFKNYIYIERVNDKPVKYTVYGIRLPQIPLILEQTKDQEKMGYFFYQGIRGYRKATVDGFDVSPPIIIFTEGGWCGKKFAGQERRDAMAYAEGLAKEHNAELVKFGF